MNNKPKVPEPGGSTGGTETAGPRGAGGSAEKTGSAQPARTPEVAAAPAPVEPMGKVGGGGLEPVPPPAKPPKDIDVRLEVEEGGSLTLADYKLPEKRVTPREKGAMWVAQAIVAFFGISLILVIALGFKLLFAMIDSPQNAKELFGASLIPFLEKVASFFSIVFSPLLAFILGYYFGEKQTQRP